MDTLDHVAKYFAIEEHWAQRTEKPDVFLAVAVNLHMQAELLSDTLPTDIVGMLRLIRHIAVHNLVYTLTGLHTEHADMHKYEGALRYLYGKCQKAGLL
jgi:hypothetical protein